MVGEATDDGSEIWAPVAERADRASVHLFYDIALAGIRDLAHAPDPLVGVKMSVLRMLAFAPAEAEVGGTPPPQANNDSAQDPPSAPSAPATAKASAPASGIAQVRAQLNGTAKPDTDQPARASTNPPSNRKRSPSEEVRKKCDEVRISSTAL